MFVAARPDPKVVICTPIYDRPTMDYLRSFMALERPWPTLNEIGHITSSARQRLTSAALAAGATHLMFIDDDMTFPPDAITRLLSWDLPIVSGLAFMRRKGFAPTIFYAKPESTPVRPLFKPADTWPADERMQADATGAAFLLVKREVFDGISMKFGEGSWWYTPSGCPGEDIAFCIRAKAAGFPITIDTGLKIGHVATVVLHEALAKFLAEHPESLPAALQGQ